jgi:hypothetical protein
MSPVADHHGVVFGRVSARRQDILDGLSNSCIVTPACSNVDWSRCCRRGPDDIGKDVPAKLEVLDANGERRTHRRSAWRAGLTGENRFCFLPMQMVFRDEGRHNFILSAGRASASVGLQIAFG